MKELTRDLIEEDSSQCLKTLSQYTVKKTKIDRLRFEMFCLREISNSFDKYDNKHTCTRSSCQASLPFAVFFCFFLKTNERKIEASWSQTQCPVFERLQCHANG